MNLLVIFGILTFALSSSVAAQSESGSGAIEGSVTDPASNRVLGATVTIRNLETGYTRTVITDEAGHFVAQAMPVGRYAIEAQAPGFAASRYDDVLLTVGATKTLNLALSIEPVRVSVTVVGERWSADRVEPAAATSLLNSSIAGLPIRGRNFTEFIQLTPAVLQESDRSGLVISGQRSINSNIAIDGADFNDPLRGNQRGGNEPVFTFPQSAVQEFQVIRSGASAEVGRTNAGFINVVTRSGTNDWRGEVFYFNRNRWLTSPDAFGRSLNNAQNQVGASVGGPLRQDRAFFFAAAEQNWLRVPFVVEFNPQPPGVKVPPELLALEGEQKGTNNPTSVFLRSDWILSPRHSVNLHYHYFRMQGKNFNFDSARLNEAASTNYTREGDGNAFKGGIVSVFEQLLVNEARVQVATDHQHEVPNLFAPEMQITGFGSIGGDSGRPRLFESSRYQVTDNLTWGRGAHLLRLGFDLNFNRVRQQREANIQGRYNFKSLVDFMARRINRYRQTVPGFNPEDLLFRGAQTELAFYGLDKLTLHQRLTLTFGLRWEGLWNPQPVRANLAVPETAFIPHDLDQWQPRLGLAWTPSKAGRNVLRLAGGLYIARTPATLFQRVFTDNGVTTVAVDSRFDKDVLNFVKFPGPLTQLPPRIKVPAPRVFGVDPSFRNPRSFQTSATFEQLLGSNLVMSVGYLHNSTWNLERRLDRNLFPPVIDAGGMPIFPKNRPKPNIGRLSINESSAHSSYDGLVLVAATRPMEGRLHFQANYTLARNIDDDSNERNYSRETALNPFDLSIEKAYSKQDVRHHFKMYGLLNLRWGLVLSAILLTRTGFPYTPVSGSDVQNDGNDDNDRAIINGRVAARNSFRQPSFFNLDLRLLKYWRWDDLRFDLVAEAFNVTRASNRHFGNDSVSEFGTPSEPLASGGQPLFAPSTARFGGPRQLQLGLRLVF